MVKKIFIYPIIFSLIIACTACHQSQPANHSAPFKKAAYAVLENPGSAPKSFAVATNIHVILDSLSSLKVMDSLIDGKKLLQLDGIAHFTIDHATQPVIIYTGMMKLTTQNVDFKINAYSESPGQSLKVFSGRLIATKSYKSDFPNTDTLERGEMILINIDIDLMEKETFDTSAASNTL